VAIPVRTAFSVKQFAATTYTEQELSEPVLSPRRGRPRKFDAPSRAVTLTLPEHVIDALGRVDTDLSRAVVRLAQADTLPAARRPAEVATFGRHAVIIVTPSKTLERQAGVTLVPLPDGRALIAFPQSTTVADLELHLDDALREGRLPAADRDVFDAIADILRSARHSSTVALQQRHIIVLETKRPSRRRVSARRPAAPRPRRA
jgi:hypothetical protein